MQDFSCYERTSPYEKFILKYRSEHVWVSKIRIKKKEYLNNEKIWLLNDL